MQANAKPNSQLQHIISRYVVDNEIAPKDLTGDGATKALEHANAKAKSRGTSGFDIGALDVVREVLIDSMTSVVDAAGSSSQALRNASSTHGASVGFGGSSSVGSPAYARFDLEIKPNSEQTLHALTCGDGEQPVFERLGNALERSFAATADARTSPRGRPPALEDLVMNRTFAGGLVELLGKEEPGDLGDAMGALGEKAGPDLAKYLETFGADLGVYQQTQAPRPKSEPGLTALRSALSVAVKTVRDLEMPAENIFRTKGGRAAFASLVKDSVGQPSISPERQKQFQAELNAATPIELKPSLFNRVELGETKAGHAHSEGDLAAFTSLLTKSDGLIAQGAFRKAEQLLQDDAPRAQEFGEAALAAATMTGAEAYAARLAALLETKN